MMVEPHAFDYKLCLQEAREFQTFLGAQQTLRERSEVLPFFKARKHLSAFMGAYNSQIFNYNRLAHEYNFFGDFACDLVAGDWDRRSYVLVEFEDARPNSIFKTRGRRTPEWSPRLEHGFSQLVDWFYKLGTQRDSTDFEQRFGARSVQFIGLLVIGRRHPLGPREQGRLGWRQRHVLVNGHPVHCLTFDDLCEAVLERLRYLPGLGRSRKR